jgi:hypothetical protein
LVYPQLKPIFQNTKKDKTPQKSKKRILKIFLEKNHIDLQKKILKIFGVDMGYTYISNMKQTAVEWLVEQLNLHEYEDVIEQAKEMEKEQIIKSALALAPYRYVYEAEQYYNQTFKSE